MLRVWQSLMQRFSPHPPEMPERDDAFGLLCYALARWEYGLRLRYAETGLLPGERPQDVHPEGDTVDIALARLSEERSGGLDTLLLAPTTLQRLRTTAPYLGKLPRDMGEFDPPASSLLAVLLEQASPQEGRLLWRTLRTVEPVVLLRFLYAVQSLRSEFVHASNYHLLQNEVVTWLEAEGFSKIQPDLSVALPAEKQDVLKLIASGKKRSGSARLLDILPPDDELCQWSAESIARRLAEYQGISVTELHRRLQRGCFLDPHEHIGEVILRDVNTLRPLGVTRHQLSEALREAMLLGEVQWYAPADWQRQQSIPHELSPEGQQERARLQARIQARYGITMDEATGEWRGGEPPFHVEMVLTMGHHQDPFHSDYTYLLSRDVGGSCDCVITNRSTGESIRLGDMLPYLIRRACFFEGSVPYRLDPEKTCRVLGLISA